MAVRRTFAEIVQSVGVDPRIEYVTLWNLFNRSFDSTKGLNVGYVHGPYSGYTGYSFKKYLSSVFERLPVKLRKTYRSFATFDAANGFDFEEDTTADLDTLLTYLEYTLSFINIACESNLLNGFNFAIKPFSTHCTILAERLAHQLVLKDGFTYLVPASMPVIEVARLLPEELSYKTYMYNHRSVTGDIEKKKETLYALAQQLEPRRSELSSELAKVIFGLVNTANVRHNNVDPDDPSKYQPKIAALSKDEFENLYDDIYEMMLLAFMHLDAKPVIARRTPFLQGLKS